jgi:hypothetical protein
MTQNRQRSKIIPIITTPPSNRKFNPTIATLALSSLLSPVPNSLQQSRNTHPLTKIKPQASFQLYPLGLTLASSPPINGAAKLYSKAESVRFSRSSSGNRIRGGSLLVRTGASPSRTIASVFSVAVRAILQNCDLREGGRYGDGRKGERTVLRQVLWCLSEVQRWADREVL